MMTIVWADKPAHFDTKLVERVWFERSTLRYTVQGTASYVHTAKLREVQIILSEEAYAQSGRGKATESCTILTFGLPCSLPLGHSGPCSPIDTRKGKNY